MVTSPFGDSYTKEDIIMNFKTHNDDDLINADGTCLQGIIKVEYSTLVDMFGEPQEMSGPCKTDWEWTVEFDDGSVATIYNWKNGPNYCGDAGLYRHEVIAHGWHIGARDKNTVRLLEEAIAYPQVHQQMDAMSESMNAVGGE